MTASLAGNIIEGLVTFGCFLSTAFDSHSNNVSLGVGRALVRKASDINIGRIVNDLGYVTVDIETDLEKLFNWNVKQLFLYLVAEYKTEKNAVNQIVLWDKIIQRGEASKLNYKNLNSKYYFWDDGLGLKGNTNVTLTLHWNVVPNAGRLINVPGVGNHKFAFPNEYLSTR